ncbi:hypothetical protein GCM10010472_48290 [Pseudonocardia halophobica]|uniref:Uncharacterized protein n=1 Tax=Pseudonocardia halophobica TaxID=29401 RepID=A0A9W6NXN1_9PSEU|nr:hypothetical protein GCM10017577_47890 [Pseudonocardia halophobica]
MDWGSVPDWFSAIATVGALGAAVFAGRAAYGQLKLLENENADRQRLERQADAAGVALWVRVGTEDKLPLVRYINQSGKPIYDLTIWIDTPAHRFRVHRAVAGPSSEPRRMRQGTAELRSIAERVDYGPDWAGLLNGAQLRCASRFRDSANQWWLRGFDGTLESATGRPAAPQGLGACASRAGDEGIGVAADSDL